MQKTILWNACQTNSKCWLLGNWDSGKRDKGKEREYAIDRKNTHMHTFTQCFRLWLMPHSMCLDSFNIIIRNLMIVRNILFILQYDDSVDFFFILFVSLSRTRFRFHFWFYTAITTAVAVIFLSRSVVDTFGKQKSSHTHTLQFGANK